MRYVVSVTFVLAFAPFALSQEFKMEPPKSPADSLKCIKARPGFKVELMVAEPLVQSPIAFAWGPDGKFWVVEMGDYPLGVDGKGKAGGMIKYLEKSKPDGTYDKATLFLDNLGFPTGVFPYDKGILVTCAPDIFYVPVGKDGRPGKKEILFTGFKEGNQQHRVNGLTWGIDNWIYGANGDSGGVVKSIKTGKEVDIRGRDFRLKVETGEFEAVSGQSQFGRCPDDWGNWFGNNNSNPMFHYVLDDRYLKRNPHVLYPDPKVQVPVIPGAQRVYPISKPLERFNSPAALNHFTSACSTIIYRDTLFGKEFEGNMFVSEPVHNLVHREIVKPKGVTFTSQRADDEQTSEFLASSDNWFRPTMIQVGPDGALWIADMYRYVIEHPEWIPKDWQKKLDLRAGHDLGRIYRVYPADKKPRDIPRLDKMKVDDLVNQLQSPSGWVRDTAHQLLTTESYFVADMETALRALTATIEKSPLAQARLHALNIYTSPQPSPVRVGRIGTKLRARMGEDLFADPHPALRKRAIELLAESDQKINSAKIFALANDDSEQVRQQLAYSVFYLGDLQDAIAPPKCLINLLLNNAKNPYIVAAGLSSITKDTWPLVFLELREQKQIPAHLFVPLTRLAKAHGGPLDSTLLFFRQVRMQESLPVSQMLLSVGDMLDVMNRNDMPVKMLLETSGDPEAEKTLKKLKAIHARAAKIAQDPKAVQGERTNAVRLLGRGLGDDRADHKLMLTLLTPQTPDDLQGAVVQQLGGVFDPRVPGLLLSSWKSYSPALRGQVLDTLFSRAIWTKMTLEAIRLKQVPAQEIDAIRRQRLLQHKDAQIRETAAKLFDAASDPDRAKVVNLYWLQMPEKADAVRGAKLFTKACAVCHKLGDVGQNVGPDLASVGDKSPQGLLTAILDPNRAVEARYVNYVASTKQGLIVTGILTSETSTSITLTAADGKQHQLLRNELDELASTGKSMMPEGLEKDLTPQDIADIIAFVRSNQQATKRLQLPGNEPRTVKADDGILILLPATAAVYGKTIKIEKKYGNFGFWSTLEDRVVWKIEAPKTGKYSVWIYYACAPDSADNELVFEHGGEMLSYRVVSTGSWDDYRGEKIGVLALKAGTQEITVRGVGKIRGALLDLKKVELVAPR